MDAVLKILEGWDASHVLALINACGGSELAKAAAAGSKKVTLEDVIQILFDKSHGRGIPFPGMKGKVVDANWAYRLTQPTTFDYVNIVAKLQALFGTAYKFMSAGEFQTRCETVIERVKGYSLIANLFQGPHFPFVLPQLEGDPGKLLNDVLVPIMERAYVAQFPDRGFTNYRFNELEKQVVVVPGTRQERLIQAMAQESVCGVYFPALQGFGIEADREFVACLPGDLILAGMEVPAVVAAYPDVFGRDGKTPVLDLASLQWQSADNSLYFNARDVSAHFDDRRLRAHEHFTGGLSVLG